MFVLERDLARLAPLNKIFFTSFVKFILFLHLLKNLRSKWVPKSCDSTSRGCWFIVQFLCSESFSAFSRTCIPSNYLNSGLEELLLQALLSPTTFIALFAKKVDRTREA